MILPLPAEELQSMPYEDAVAAVMKVGYDREAAEFVVGVVSGETGDAELPVS